MLNLTREEVNDMSQMATEKVVNVVFATTPEPDPDDKFAGRLSGRLYGTRGSVARMTPIPRDLDTDMLPHTRTTQQRPSQSGHGLT